MRRIACLWFPDWPIQRLRAARPELRERAVALGSQPENALHLETQDAYADALALRALACACDKFSPVVGVEQVEPPENLLLDVTGLGRLFDGEKNLIRQAVEEFSRRQYTVCAALADTVGAAWAGAHFLAEPRSPIVLPPRERKRLFALPLEGLRLAPKTIALFHQLGVYRIAEVARLPRQSLAIRFGPEVTRRLDELTGKRDEAVVAHRPATEFKETSALEHPITSNDSLEQGLRVLVDRLTAALAASGRGAVALSLAMEFEGARPLHINLGTCRASVDGKHLFELIRLYLQRERLPGPVRGMTLAANQSAPLEWRQGNLFSGRANAAAGKQADLTDRLSSRLGRDAVVQARLRADVVPERAFQYVPVVGSRNGRRGAQRGAWPRACQRPLALLCPPQPIEVSAEGDRPLFVDAKKGTVPLGAFSLGAFFLEGVRHDVARLWGPERIETAWWRGPSVRRDYYRVETPDGRRFWLFRRLQDRKWFLHGRFD